MPPCIVGESGGGGAWSPVGESGGGSGESARAIPWWTSGDSGERGGGTFEREVSGVEGAEFAGLTSGVEGSGGTSAAVSGVGDVN